MSMKKTGFLRERVLQLIGTEGGEWPEGRLPTVRALASALGTSQVTIIKVLKLLVGEGVLEVLPGRDGYFIAGRADSAAHHLPLAPARSRHTEIADRLREELIAGVYPMGGPIPSLKEIRNRFACGHASVRAAIQELLNQNMLAPRGRGYVHRVPGKPTANRSHLCFTSLPAVMWSYQRNTHHFIRAIETDIERLGWEDLKYFLSKEPLETRASPAERYPIAAYLFFSFHEALAIWKRYFERHAGVPVIVIDPGAGIDVKSLPGKRYFVVATDNVEAGKNVGAMLAGLGHHRIALISHEPPDRTWHWARARMQGLASVFPLEGSSDGRRMTVHTLPPETVVFPEQLRMMECSVSRAFGLSKEAGGVPAAMAHEDFASVYGHIRNQRDALRLEPILDQLLTEGAITAIVCLNDSIAALAQQYLLQLNIDVPGRISVCGFDNSSLSRRLGITTYDFCYDRMGHTAIQYILRPMAFRGHRRKMVRVTGQVVVRESTGTPRTP